MCTPLIIVSIVLMQQSVTGHLQELGPLPRVMSSAAILDHYLQAWEQKLFANEGLSIHCKLTETQTLPPESSVYSGDAAYLRPNYFRLQLRSVSNPGDERRARNIAASGDKLWLTDLDRKQNFGVRIPQAGWKDPTLSLLMGMRAAEIKKRFQLQVDVEDQKKNNDYYFHIVVRPKSNSDREYFRKAEIVLWIINQNPGFRDSYGLPARIWFQLANGNQATWEFKNIRADKKLEPADFKAPSFPEKPPKPTISRTSAPAK